VSSGKDNERCPMANTPGAKFPFGKPDVHRQDEKSCRGSPTRFWDVESASDGHELLSPPNICFAGTKP
jgi:hypothetical protein